MLDSGPLGKLAHANPNPADVQWLDDLLGAGVKVYLPEIADFEVRRNLLVHRLVGSLQKLDDLRSILVYVPISTAAMRLAAEFWAALRRSGKPLADPKALDCDVILAAQAIQVRAIVATDNLAHVSRLVTARHWRSIQP
jgi:predicted nucleic acid-binding protein